MNEQPITPKQHEIRFTNRRRLAWSSFVLLSLVGVVLIGIGLQSDALAARVESLSFLIVALLTVWAGVIAAYFGVSGWVNVAKGI